MRKLILTGSVLFLSQLAFSDVPQGGSVKVVQNEVEDFDAKGFALDLRSQLQADKVIVEDVQPSADSTIFRAAEPIRRISNWFKKSKTHYINKRPINVWFSVIKDHKKYSAATHVIYAEHVESQKQVAWIIDMGNDTIFGTEWWDEWGERYDPHLDSKSGKRSLLLKSQEAREAEEGSRES